MCYGALMRCSVPTCENDAYQTGLCSAHYTRKRRGKPMDEQCTTEGCVAPAVRIRPTLCRTHLDEEASPDGLCRTEDCKRPASRRGLCTTHYFRQYERGTLDLQPRRTPEERFWAMVTKTEDCWLYTGNSDGRGYGKFEIQRRSYDGTRPAVTMMAHRYAYTLLVGPILEDLELDHLCEVKLCVRPDHLDPITRAEHQRRTYMRRTHCNRGHALTSENVRMRGTVRVCRECERITARARKARLRGELPEL